MVYKSPELGQQMSVMVYSVDEKFFQDNSHLEKIVKDALLNHKFTLLNFNLEPFPKGCTILATLSESHFALHTYQEYSSIYLNMYSCRGPKDAEQIINYVSKQLNSKDIVVIEKNKVPASKKAALDLIH